MDQDVILCQGIVEGTTSFITRPVRTGSREMTLLRSMRRGFRTIANLEDLCHGRVEPWHSGDKTEYQFIGHGNTPESDIHHYRIFPLFGIANEEQCDSIRSIFVKC